jgi:YVTN family beta-propeller protein
VIAGFDHCKAKQAGNHGLIITAVSRYLINGANAATLRHVEHSPRDRRSPWLSCSRRSWWTTVMRSRWLISERLATRGRRINAGRPFAPVHAISALRLASRRRCPTRWPVLEAPELCFQLTDPQLSRANVVTKAAGSPPDGSTAYVSNDKGSTVSVISTETNTVTATIPVGPAPFGLVATPDGSTVYGANGGSNTVSAIGTAIGDRHNHRARPAPRLRGLHHPAKLCGHPWLFKRPRPERRGAGAPVWPLQRRSCRPWLPQREGAAKCYRRVLRGIASCRPRGARRVRLVRGAVR